ncbi:MAG: hypothetical protein HC772_01075 [Leptolyngbyaceae cyanobacterium CRU_2_3]|nr:hypothetical protein [Leptolyngbyaceae cyanobacterium CRU_2_3]
MPPNLGDIQGHWSQPLITALANANIIQSSAEGHFRPDDPVTQEQFLSMVQRAFPDEEITSEMIHLRSGMTRAEAAKVVYQALLDQGRILPLETRVAAQNPPLSSANATPGTSQATVAPQPIPPHAQPGGNLVTLNQAATLNQEGAIANQAQATPFPLSQTKPASSSDMTSPEAVQPESATSNTVFAVVGEVSRPGTYRLPDIDTNRPLTLIQAIQMAGGVTSQANVRQIQVRRGSNVWSLDLWQLLQAGNLSQDIVLQPGDMVAISRAMEPGLAKRIQLIPPAAAAPIQVSVIGEVKNPGRIELPSNTSVSQAILASGGFSRHVQQAELIRLNANGTIARRAIAIDLAQAINESTNPRLQNNDVILVQPSGNTIASSISSNRGVKLTSLLAILPTTAAVQQPLAF